MSRLRYSKGTGRKVIWQVEGPLGSVVLQKGGPNGAQAEVVYQGENLVLLDVGPHYFPQILRNDQVAKEFLESCYNDYLKREHMRRIQNGAYVPEDDSNSAAPMLNGADPFANLQFSPGYDEGLWKLEGPAGKVVIVDGEWKNSYEIIATLADGTGLLPIPLTPLYFHSGEARSPEVAYKVLKRAYGDYILRHPRHQQAEGIRRRQAHNAEPQPSVENPGESWKMEGPAGKIEMKPRDGWEQYYDFHVTLANGEVLSPVNVPPLYFHRGLAHDYELARDVLSRAYGSHVIRHPRNKQAIPEVEQREEDAEARPVETHKTHRTHKHALQRSLYMSVVLEPEETKEVSSFILNGMGSTKSAMIEAGITSIDVVSAHHTVTPLASGNYLLVASEVIRAEVPENLIHSHWLQH